MADVACGLSRTGRCDELSKREDQLKTQLNRNMVDFFRAFDNIRVC